MVVRETPRGDWPHVHREGDGWVKLDTGDTGLIAVFNPSKDRKRPSLHLGAEGLVNDAGLAFQILRYDHHAEVEEPTDASGKHKHRFTPGWEIRVPLYGDESQRLTALICLFDEGLEEVLQDLDEVGYRDIALKLQAGNATSIAEQIEALIKEDFAIAA